MTESDRDEALGRLIEEADIPPGVVNIVRLSARSSRRSSSSWPTAGPSAKLTWPSATVSTPPRCAP